MIFLVVKGPLEDSRASRFGNFHSPVGAEGIENDDVVTPFDRLKAGRKHRFFVQGQNENRDAHAEPPRRATRNINEPNGILASIRIRA